MNQVPSRLRIIYRSGGAVKLGVGKINCLRETSLKVFGPPIKFVCPLNLNNFQQAFNMLCYNFSSQFLGRAVARAPISHSVLLSIRLS